MRDFLGTIRLILSNSRTHTLNLITLSNYLTLSTGQFLSASVIREMFPNDMICGIGADIIFMWPVMRQVMAWIGTQRAGRKNITKILDSGHHCAVIPGGIAEMVRP